MIDRRTFSKVMAAGAASASAIGASAASATAAQATARGGTPQRHGAPGGPGLGPVRSVRTQLLDIAYHEAGPADGKPVILAHGWPYSPHAYAEVVPALVRDGHHVFVPYLRGHGPTAFRDKDTFRSGQQAALGADVIDFMDVLGIRSALFGGYDWGGRGLNVAAALWPERCTGLVSVNSYLIQHLTHEAVDGTPDLPETESAHWYFFYFLTARGRLGLTRDPRAVADVVWKRNSPHWNYTSADLDRAAGLFGNPDYVDVVIHSYRHRLLEAPGDPRYDTLEARLLKQPPITVPAVTLDGRDDGSFRPTDGQASAPHFTGPRVHHQVPRAGHNLPQETPRAFVDAIREVSHLR